MIDYALPQVAEPPPLQANEVILIASGDSRLAANQVCWEAQADMEKRVVAALAQEGVTVKRGHPYDPELKHRFYLESADGDGCVCGGSSECPFNCRRGCLAV